MEVELRKQAKLDSQQETGGQLKKIIEKVFIKELFMDVWGGLGNQVGIGRDWRGRGERVYWIAKSCICRRGPPERHCGLWELENATFPFFKAAHITQVQPRTVAADCMRHTYSRESSQPTLRACPLHQPRKTAPLTTLKLIVLGLIQHYICK